MLYFRCKYYGHCGGNSCADCNLGKAEKREELNKALMNLSLVLPAGPTDNEIYVATREAEKKYGRKF